MTALIIILLICVIIYGIFDARKVDREQKENKKRFDEKYKR